MKTKIGRDNPRHTWLDHHFQGQKVKGQGHQAALLSTALTRQAAAAVSVGTFPRWPLQPYSAWESRPTAILRSSAGAPTWEKSLRGGAYSVAMHTAYYVCMRMTNVTGTARDTATLC